MEPASYQGKITGCFYKWNPDIAAPIPEFKNFNKTFLEKGVPVNLELIHHRLFEIVADQVDILPGPT
jgi:hypothetical protein